MAVMQRAAARCGLGAVMGSKKLKAVVVKGNKKPELANAPTLREEMAELVKFQVANRGGMHDHGTSEGLIGNELSGDLPIRNWGRGAWDGKSERISGEEQTKQYHAVSLSSAATASSVVAEKSASTKVPTRE